MNKFCIQLNNHGYCLQNTILQEVPENWIEISCNLFSKAEKGRRFDVENMKWMDMWDETLIIPMLSETISWQEKILMETAVNIEYLACISELNIISK